MLLGTITLETCYGPAVIPVELLGKGPRPGTVWIKALGGRRPFTKMSHGGPCQDDTLVMPIPLVWDVREADPGHEHPPA